MIERLRLYSQTVPCVGYNTVLSFPVCVGPLHVSLGYSLFTDMFNFACYMKLNDDDVEIRPRDSRSNIDPTGLR